MTEEKKDDLNEQQSFLDGHEELLKNITDKKVAPVPETDSAEPEANSAQEPETSIEDFPLPKKPVEIAPKDISDEKEASVGEEKPSPAGKAVAVAPKPKSSAPKNRSKNSSSKKKKKKKKPQHPHHHTERDDTAAQRHEELLKQQQLEQQEVKEVLVFVQKYAKPVVTGILVVCVLVLANGFFKNRRLKKEARADSALLHAQGASDLQAIIDDYPSTPSAPLAEMALAMDRFNAGSFDEAESLYRRFIKKHAGHELAPQAQLNLIGCKEAKGQKEEAQQLYADFAKAHGGSYLVPSAMLGQARCLEALGKFAEARTVYEDIIADFPDSAWSQSAEMNLAIVKAKLD